MSTTAGILNLILGVVYTSYGVMTLIDLRAGWRERGPSHFGFAWVFMAFTCGPHHLHHGLHILFEGRNGGMLDIVAVAVGFPAGVAWFLLRLEALHGGSGDRLLRGTPAWVEAIPTMSAAYLALGATLAWGVAVGPLAWEPIVTPNVLLVVLYVLVGVVVGRTQLMNHRVTGTWSLSGVSLAVIFPTCALMHGAYALYASTGRYVADGHGFLIDTLSVPAAVYFLWVVIMLQRGQLHDWNEAAAHTSAHEDVTGGSPPAPRVPTIA